MANKKGYPAGLLMTAGYPFCVLFPYVRTCISNIVSDIWELFIPNIKPCLKFDPERAFLRASDTH